VFQHSVFELLISGVSTRNSEQSDAGRPGRSSVVNRPAAAAVCAVHDVMQVQALN
jgi:hypothetical protein